MSRIPATAVLWSLAALASGAAAQLSNEGRVREQADVQTCGSSGGGTRARANCELAEPATTRTEQEIRITIEPKPLSNAQCEAVTSTSYHQRNTVARIEGAIQVKACAAASGKYTVAVRVRNDAGEVETLEFPETWERSDARDVALQEDYPIGENMELMSIRVRGLSCTCADAPAEAAAAPATQN
jgi:hypothetical protein